jgi:hypothetical protein
MIYLGCLRHEMSGNKAGIDIGFETSFVIIHIPAGFQKGKPATARQQRQADISRRRRTPPLKSTPSGNARAGSESRKAHTTWVEPLIRVLMMVRAKLEDEEGLAGADNSYK